MNTQEVIACCCQQWHDLPPPVFTADYLQDLANVPVEAWAGVPDDRNYVPIPQCLYDPHDFSGAGVHTGHTGIVLNESDKLLCVVCTAVGPMDHEVLNFFLFTWA